MNFSEKLRRASSDSNPKHIASFRFESDLFARLIRRQTVLTVPSVSSHCVYSRDSLRGLLDDESTIYLSEGVAKTYPADAMTRDFTRFLASNCKKSVIAGLTANGKDVFFADYSFSNETAAFQQTVKRINADTDIGTGKHTAAVQPIVVKAGYSGVQTDEAAARIDLEICDSSIDPKIVMKYADRAYTFGYTFVACSRVERSSHLIVAFEAKFQKNEVKVGDYLYHICPACVVSKIIRQGLVPKSKTKMRDLTLNHDDRIYLLTSPPTDNDVLRFAMLSKDKFLDDDAVVLKIKVSGVPHLKLFRDPMTKHEDGSERPVAVYTTCNIPPSAIEIFDAV